MIRVRAMESQDVPCLIEIARHAATAALWTEQQFAALCSAETSRERLCLVISEEEQVHGFLVAKSITLEDDEWEIENIAISAAARRRGFGSHLLGESLNRMRARGGRRIFLEVRESNEAAHKLYEKWAFEQVGRRKNYYQDPIEDALIFRFSFPQFD
jgi:ribosomal-protein-alanine N-acetyltransferase